MNHLALSSTSAAPRTPVSAERAEFIHLRAMVDRLEAENEHLRAALDAGESPLASLRLTPQERTLLSLLMRAPLVTHDMVLGAFEARKPTSDGRGREHVFVVVRQLRDRLRPLGIEVKNSHGQGYFLTPDMKDRVRDVCRKGGRS